MTNRNAKSTFYQDNASSYDEQRSKLAAFKDALHLCIRLKFSDLPEDARILCVGAGTGAEMFYLANEFPQWQFTAVEPAPAMLKVCRQQAQDLGVTSRCSFHEGYLDTLPDSDKFDAATSILVSHFIVDEQQRKKFFSEISTRLKPGAFMVNADLAYDMTSSTYNAMLAVWENMLNFADMPMNIDAFGRHIALVSTDQLESILNSSGFQSPVQFFQSLLIHAWFSEVSA